MTTSPEHDYKGTIAKPSDFDDYWDRLVKQIPQHITFSLEEKDFGIKHARCCELKISRSADSQIYAKCIFPKSIEKFPVIFSFHGYQGRSPDWSEGLKFIANDFGIVYMDVRGQAGLSLDCQSYAGNTVKGHIIRGLAGGRDGLFYKDIYLDTYYLIEAIAQLDEVDADQLYTLGASQGGALALVAAALNHRIRAVTAVYPFLADFGQVLASGCQSEAYDELFRFFKFQDPLHYTEKTVMDTLAYIDVKNFAERIHAEVLLITGLADKVCPPITQFAIYNNLNTKKEHLILPEYAHEDMNVYIKDIIYNWLTHSKIK